MASTNLSRTTWGTATNDKIFTMSVWVKRSGLGYQQIANSYASGLTYDNQLKFQNTDAIELSVADNTVPAEYWLKTNRLFRDTSAWYHIVFAFDSTQATASDRYKLYVNGVQETSFSTSDYPPLNTTYSFFNNSNANNIGSQHGGTGGFFNGLMAHFHFIDGTAYDASAFGETDATTGIWKPKTAPSVTYGTNGFFLKFENGGAFGTDSSGNANTFTVNGTMTQNIDTPSNVFATLNPLARSTTSGNYSNGNLTFDRPGSTASWVNTVSTLGASSGKYYWEYKVIDAGTPQNGCVIGFMNIDGSDFQNRSDDLNQSSSEQNIGWYPGGNLFNQVSTIDTFNTYIDGDIIQLAMDLDNGYLYWGKNGTWENSADPTSGVTGTGGKATSLIGTNGQYVFSIAHREDGNGSANFGNGYFGTTAVSSAQNPDDGIGIFEYDVPAGYKALCTKSINAQEYD
jgi:hypothetical protein